MFRLRVSRKGAYLFYAREAEAVGERSEAVWLWRTALCRDIQQKTIFRGCFGNDAPRCAVRCNRWYGFRYLKRLPGLIVEPSSPYCCFLYQPAEEPRISLACNLPGAIIRNAQ